MTVNVTYSPPQYTGNGVTTSFAFNFAFFATSDLIVDLFDTAAGADVSPQPVLGGGGTYDYTITGTPDPDTGEYPNATIVFNHAPLANHRVTVTRSVAAVQGTSYIDDGPFPAKTVEAALDRLTMLAQQLLAVYAKVPQFPASDPSGLSVLLPPASSRANMGLAFDSVGQPIVGALPSIAVSAAMQTVFQAASIAAGRAALGLGSAALLTAGVAASNAVQLDGSARLPALNGSLLTNLPSQSGFRNKLRNTSQSAWFHGTAITVTTAGAWTSEGVYAKPTGASIAASQVTNNLTSPLSVFATKLTGAASVTGLVVRFPIESYDAAPLAGQVVTVQIPVRNDTGATITPALTVKHAGAQDDFTTPVTDVNAVALQSIANGATGVLAYTFTAAAASGNGLSIDIDFGNNFSTSGKSVTIGGGFDCSATPGVATGLNAAPPLPEPRSAADDITWCQRFFFSTYDNGVAPGTSIINGILDMSSTSGAGGGAGVMLPVRLRGDPSVSFWDRVGNASKFSTFISSSWADAQGGTSSIVAAGMGSVMFSVGASLNNPFVHLTADATIAGA